MKYMQLTLRVILLSGVLSFLTTSCINEDLDDCYRLTLKVVNAQGDDITASGDASVARIYVFDENENYLQTIWMDAAEITSRKEIVLEYPRNSRLHFLAWGNAEGDEYKLQEGQSMADFTLQLKSQNELATEPGQELFYGNKSINTKAGGVLTQNEEIVIGPKIATVRMYTQGLSYYRAKRQREGLRADGDDFVCDFYLNKTLDSYNYSGTLKGDSIYYNPDGEWTDTLHSDWETPKGNDYRIFSGENLRAGLHLDGMEFDTVVKDINGNPITVQETENVIVVFMWGEDGAYLGAKVKVRPWGYVDDSIEW